jgi:hypothetical protein
MLGLRSLRKYRKFTVITSFVPYRSGFLTVNLQYHVLMTNRLFSIYLNKRVLDRSNDILLGDWVDKSDNE